MKREIVNQGTTSITFTLEGTQVTLEAGKSISVTSDRAIKQFEELKKRSQLLSKVELTGTSMQSAQSKANQKAVEDAEKIRLEAQEAAKKRLEEAKKLEEAKAAEEAKKLEEARKAAEEEAKKLEAQKAAEEAKKLEEAKAAEEAKKLEEQKVQQEKEEARRIAKEEAAKLAQAVEENK